MGAYIDGHPVFGADRPNAARASYYALRSALAAYGQAGGAWGDPSGRLAERVREAREVRAMYAEYGDSLFGGARGELSNRS